MMTDPKLTLTFTANDLPSGHSTTQVLNDCDLVRDSFEFKRSRLNGLKSSSDTVNLQIRKGCASVEDIIATEGNIQAVLSDGETILYTGFIATSHSLGVTDHGEQALNVTIESMGTRLLNKPFIETGKHFFVCTASAAIYSIITPLGIIFRPGEERKLLQSVRRTVEAGETCRELLDSLFYECNAVYYFNELGQLCVQPIDADTENVPTYDKEKLRMVDRKVVSLSKKLRTYSGARVAYTELASADNYLVYRNTTGQDSTHPYCNLELQAGEYFDGTEIYTAQEWSEAQADTFREPALIGAVNAASESQIVGSNKIVSIDNLSPEVVGAGMTCEFENVGGGYFKLTAHNGSGGERSFFRMDLYASIIYVKSNGVIRTQIDGPSAGKSTLEESLTWIHDRDNATKHANLLAQYHRYASASYTFYANENIPLGSVVKLHDNVFSGLEVYVLVTASQKRDNSSTIAYSAVGVSTFNLDQDAYHGISEPARQSGQQGPPGAPGEAAEVQYALGTSLTEPPSAEMQWGGEDMLWNGEQMIWNDGLYTDDIPALVRGMYVWMRSRVGEQLWQYTRLTGATAWEAENLGIAMTETPKTSRQGLNLTVGDYFVCGALFTEDEKTYQPGYAYIYTGSAWTEMSLADEANAEKAIDLLSSLVSAEIQIPSSNSAYSVWQWTKNLVVLNAVVDNLVAKKLKVGLGNETTGFYLKIEDGNPPIIICKFNGSTLWEIDATTGKMYGNFARVRQYMPFQFEDSLDDTYPMECDFYIPANAIIVSIKLSSKGKNYRSYSKGAASGGGVLTSGVVKGWEELVRGTPSLTVTKNSHHGIQTESGGEHKHSYKKTNSVGGSNDGTHSHTVTGTSSWQGTQLTTSDPIYPSSVGNHKHTVGLKVDTSGGHSHSTIGYTDADTENGGAHQHYLAQDTVVTNVSIAKLTNDQIEHKHNVDTTHSHSLTFGIYESTTPDGVELKCSDDGGSTYGSAVSGMGTGGNVSDLDITSQFSGTGWKAIKFTSTRLGRIQAQLVVELLVTT